MLCWIHFGDVHAADDDDDWRSVDDLAALARQAMGAGALDFAYVPGDIANHGTAEQYARVREALAPLTLPCFAIPGDHDFEPGTLDAFYAGLAADPLPRAIMMKGRRCLFLDIVSNGSGGPDFRLGPDQTGWLRDQLAVSRTDAAAPLVFMHAFPGDLWQDAATIGQLFAEYDVAAVDTGHTHYNELLNDGRVIYTATRSTGQIEEGPVGASFHAVDGSVVSVRFKELARPWPFVLITSPADRRLVTDPTRRDQVPGHAFTVRAKVFGDQISVVELIVDDHAAVPMTFDGECVWRADVAGLDDGEHRIAVVAAGTNGASDRDTITVAVAQVPAGERPPVGRRPGHADHSIGPWPEHGLLGTQLGPNSNGRAW